MRTLSKILVASALCVGMIGATTATSSASPLIVRSPAACDSYSKDYANLVAGHRGGRILLGTVIGAGVGYFVGGGLFGNPLGGAVVGAGFGLAGGALIGQPQWQAEYNNAYYACISGAPLPNIY